MEFIRADKDDSVLLALSSRYYNYRSRLTSGILYDRICWNFHILCNFAISRLLISPLFPHVNPLTGTPILIPLATCSQWSSILSISWKIPYIPSIGLHCLKLQVFRFLPSRQPSRLVQQRPRYQFVKSAEWSNLRLPLATGSQCTIPPLKTKLPSHTKQNKIILHVTESYENGKWVVIGVRPRSELCRFDHRAKENSPW